VANQRQRVKIVETGETIQMTSPDQVLISGVLQSGAVASVHLKGGTANGTGFLFEIHGTEGALAIVPADPRQATYIQVCEFTVRGAQAGKPLADLSISESYRWVPPAVPAGLPFNVAQLFMRMAEGIREGKSVSPDFDVAVFEMWGVGLLPFRKKGGHRLLEGVEFRVAEDGGLDVANRHREFGVAWPIGAFEERGVQRREDVPVAFEFICRGSGCRRASGHQCPASPPARCCQYNAGG